MQSTPTAALLLILTALLSATLLAQPANAHSALAATDPPADTITTDTVDVLSLTFAQTIDVLSDSVTVTASDGATVEVIAIRRQGDGVTVLADLATPLGSGAHAVAWRVIGEDGHPIEGTYRITIDAAPVQPPPTTPDPATSQHAEEVTRVDPAVTDIPPAPTTAPSVPEPTSPRSAAVVPDPVDTDEPAEPAPSQVDARVAPSGAQPPGPGGEGGGIDVADLTQTTSRWVAFLGIMVVIGVIVFGVAVHPNSPADQAVLTRLVVVGSLLAAVGSMVQLTAHVAVISGSGLGGAVDGAAWDIVVGGGVFTGALLRVAASIGVIAATRVMPDWSHVPRHSVGVITGAAVILLSFQYTGHTATTEPTLIVRIADAAHVLAAAVWTGGIVALAGVMGARRRRADRPQTTLAASAARAARHTETTALVISRFSVAATGSVVLVGVAGTVLAAVELQSFTPLFTTGYGRVLLAKVAIVAAVGAVGAYNHTRLVPAIVAGDGHASARLQRTMRMELALFPVALILTAFLVRMSP